MRITDIVWDDIEHPTQRSHSLSTEMQVTENKITAQCDISQSRFTNVVARWPGSVHDSYIIRCSQVCTHLEESHLSVQDGLILGDSRYACMTPYLRPTEPCHEQLNKAHMKTRCSIERTFGWWKKRFNCLHQGIRIQIRMHPEKVCKNIMACAVLHNLAVEMKEPHEIVNNDCFPCHDNLKHFFWVHSDSLV
ncbi:HARBI1 [Mytilus coruscus]|uniref:HARBI1 n=1 Tax=Mytilus coruscus TaxID=42192 RepID=A0A6J8ACQ3_MYTCO|nr:HARBI1 [Mytilus coruscus]